MAFQFGTAVVTNFTKSLSTVVDDTARKVTNQYVGNVVSSVPVLGTIVTSSDLNRITGVNTTAKQYDPMDNYKVKLVSATNLKSSDPRMIERVIFDVTPQLSEDRSVEYSAVSPIHMPGSVQVYKRTNARTFAITAPIVSRTREEATRNIAILQTLRGWTLPYFGAASSTGSYSEPKGQGESGVRDAAELLGAPPDVLYLYAYSSPTSRNNRSHVNLNRIPVVLSQLGIAYPDDVDYLPTFGSNKEPMPTKMTVTLTLLETHSPFEFEQFSLQEFKAGRLKHF